MRGDETTNVKLVSSFSSDSGKVIIFSFNTTRYEVKNNIGDTLWFKLVRLNHKISGYFSREGDIWSKVGQDVDISSIDSYSDPNFQVWEGTRQGLYVQGSSSAYFDLYIYRDAYTPILAECPANQLGTTRLAQSSDTTVLDNIYYNHWAMYAGVEFGNDDYKKSADSIKVIASSATNGGTVQVYIDSIDASTEIAECNISGTGSWINYKTFSAKLTSAVSGHHDVYLLFTGSVTDKLFMLQSFYFTGHKITTGIPKDLEGYNLPQKYKLEQNYPNPFNPTTTIDYSVPYIETQNIASVQLKVYDILGNEVATLVNREQKPGNYEVEFNADNLASGVYYYRIKAGSYSQTKKMMLLK
jgi:xylan 1,4-beta-xylosidase